jgi:hypothetical protein
MALGSGNAFQLLKSLDSEYGYAEEVVGRQQQRVISLFLLANTIDEEIVLIDVYLDAGRSSIKFKECLCTMLWKVFSA